MRTNFFLVVLLLVVFSAGLVGQCVENCGAHRLGRRVSEDGPVGGAVYRAGHDGHHQPGYSAAERREPWGGEEPPAGIAPYKASPRFENIKQLLEAVKQTPVTVAEARPHDPYAKTWYGYGRGYGYGGGGLYGLGAIYSDVDPRLTLGSVLQTRFAHEWRKRGGRLLAPATGSASAQLAAIAAETSIGRNAGTWGDHTWDTASLVWELSYAVRQEKESTHGFDGSFWGALACLAGSLAGGLAGDIACTAGAGLSLVQTLEQWHEVELVLFAQLVDARTRDLVFSGEGRGQVQIRVARFASGVLRLEFRHHNAEPLAQQAVLSVFDGPPKATPAEQKLVKAQAELEATKAAVSDAKELEQTQKELRKRQAQLAKFQARRRS